MSKQIQMETPDRVAESRVNDIPSFMLIQKKQESTFFLLQLYWNKDFSPPPPATRISILLNHHFIQYLMGRKGKIMKGSVLYNLIFIKTQPIAVAISL